jgi:hypothetical protein
MGAGRYHIKLETNKQERHIEGNTVESAFLRRNHMTKVGLNLRTGPTLLVTKSTLHSLCKLAV